MNYDSQENLNKFQSILQKYKNNPITRQICHFDDPEKIEIIIWTYPKCGTTTIGNAFQKIYTSNIKFQNIIHCHAENCWYERIPELKEIDFSFNIFVDYLNSKKIKPLVYQTYRSPVSRIFSHAFHNRLTEITDDFIYHITVNYHEYLKNSIKSIYTHEYDKNKMFGFGSDENYDILYCPVEGLKNFEKNIKSVKSLKKYHNLKLDYYNKTDDRGYEEFVCDNKLSTKQIEKIYEDSQEGLSFFYTETMISELKKNELEKYSVWDGY